MSCDIQVEQAIRAVNTTINVLTRLGRVLSEHTDDDVMVQALREHITATIRLLDRFQDEL